MKTAGIGKVLALTGARPGTGILAGCGKATTLDLIPNKIKDNIQYLKDNNITTRGFDSLENASNSITKKAALKIWQDILDKKNRFSSSRSKPTRKTSCHQQP